MLERLFLSERAMLLAVMLSAIVICAMYFPSLKGSILLEYLDYCFIILFMMEALIKIKVYGKKRYFEGGWNRFDFTIAVLSLPALIVPFVDIPDASFIMILRLFRIARVARLLRFVPNMEHVLAGLGRALKASIFVLGAIAFLIFILAILSCHFYGDLDPKHFGDPLISLYSIFQLFTVEGWYEIPEAITAESESASFIGFTRLYFGLVVLLGGVFAMSLANAVFVDEMTMDNNRELETKIDQLQDQLREVREMLGEMKEKK